MMRSVWACLTACFAFNAAADQTVSVFQFDGSLFCHDVDTIPVEKARQELESAGVKVISARTVMVPHTLPGYCGTPKGRANVLVVDRGDWQRLQRSRPNALGFGVWVFEQPQVEVFKYDGSLQCRRGREIALDVMVGELQKQGIKVAASRKGHDGLTHISVCGASTGRLNVYTIDGEFLPEARALGFKLLVSRAMAAEMRGWAPARRGGGAGSRYAATGGPGRDPDPAALVTPGPGMPVLGFSMGYCRTCVAYSSRTADFRRQPPG